MQKKISSQTSVIVDAAQSVPHMPVDLQEMPCDFLVFSGHKMFSPTGVGVLYGRDGALSKLKPLIFGSQMVQKVTPEEIVYQEVPQKFEAGTLPIEAIIGLGAAVDYLSSIGMKNVRKHEQELMRYFFERSATIENLIIYGPLDTERRSGVISFNLNGIHAHDVAQVLADDNVCLRSGHHCAMPLHRRLGIEASIRISFQIYNDDEDIDKLIKSLRKVQRIFSCR
jgi:cysteine desulfurase/selenocysteine lyase